MTKRVAVVTGAARGLGQGIALSLAERGYSVACCDIGGAPETVDRIRGAKGAAESYVLDITDSARVTDCIGDIVDEMGGVDVLVNNAGLYTHNEVADTSDEELQSVFGVNYFGTFYMCRAAIPFMKRRGFGRIVNIASQVGKVARPKDAVYASSKGAVVLLTQALALELGEHGITANAICPGTMWTPMAEQAVSLAAAEQGLTLEEAKQAYISEKIPVGRYGTPEDVANLVGWLASDEAGFITGSSQNLTGGEQVFF